MSVDAEQSARVDVDLNAPVPCYTQDGKPAAWRVVNLCPSRHSCSACDDCKRAAEMFLALAVLSGSVLVCSVCRKPLRLPFAEWIRL